MGMTTQENSGAGVVFVRHFPAPGDAVEPSVRSEAKLGPCSREARFTERSTNHGGSHECRSKCWT